MISTNSHKVNSMIYTKEPANVFYVLVSAFRSNLHHLDNLSRHRRMVNSLRNNVIEYGSVESTDLVGKYHEEGMECASEEQTIRVRCASKQQAINVARLACNEYEQDCVLVYKSQTHTAGLVYAKGIDGYRAERLQGSFQLADTFDELTGAYTVDEFGRVWIVK